ncbi:MAG: hypothetical protein KJ970_04260 [Candidatus Eisenbacteria bacterium]|uniref:Uncharacterized protein n=1 Tax=Eiseniibacteriota bacterium TaxID=2212470 RepID=A0A948RV33_UNCEI|nr:hypothetical protein [Candidatus Eisenbacteria bacterium]
MSIDGFSTEFTEGESVFGINPDLLVAEESTNDSKWGAFNDINQIKVTWDAQNLYVAVDGFIFDNNVILLLDVTDRDPETEADNGLTGMTELNSWRRNFVFAQDFAPEMFLATWDGNSQPRLMMYDGPNHVTEVPSSSFLTLATFQQSSPGRSMEAAIPWSLIFLGLSSEEFQPDLGTNVWVIPDGMSVLKIAAVVTAGADGTGGPDSAPDNFCGHTNESSDQVLIDNYAIVPLDTDSIEAVPDFGIEPKDRITFKRTPPVRGVECKFKNLILDSPIASPEEGIAMRFHVNFEQSDALITARIFDMAGDEVITLYERDPRTKNDPYDEEKDLWYGMAEDGSYVHGGIYIISVVLEPGLSRVQKAFSVVR